MPVLAILAWLAFWAGAGSVGLTSYPGAVAWAAFIAPQLLLGLPIGRWWAVPLPLALAAVVAAVLAVGHDPGCVDYCDDYISNGQWAGVIIGLGAVAMLPTAVGVATRKFAIDPSGWVRLVRGAR
jgi:hypothetical protein